MNGETVVISLLIILCAVKSVSISVPCSRMKFGSSSYVTTPGEAVMGLENTPFPSIKLELLDVETSPSSETLNTANGDVLVVVSCAGANLQGSTATMFNAGIAEFSDLTFTTCPTSVCQLVFTVMSGGANACAVQGTTLRTGDVTIAPFAAFALNFASASTLRSGVSTTATVDVTLGSVMIQILDSCGNEDTTITASLTVVASVVGGGAKLDGTTIVSFTNGLAIFDNLRFAAPAPSGPVQLLFTVPPDASSGIKVCGKSITTGSITVRATTTPNFNIQFSPSNSQVTLEGQSFDIPVNGATPLPIVVQMVDSNGAFDASNSGVVITATGLQPMAVTTATVQRGVATFSALRILSCQTSRTLRLTFTAGSEGGTAAQGKSIVTGYVVVQGIANYELGFETTPGISLVSYVGQTVSTRQNSVMGDIVVTMKDSCGNVDTTTAVGGVVSVSSTASGAWFGSATSTTAALSYGRAVFRGLNMTKCGATTLLFETRNGSGKKWNVSTGTVSVVGQTNAYVSFGAGSFFAKPGDTRSVTTSVVLAPVVVQLEDSCGVDDTSNTGISIQMTSSSTLTNQGTNIQRTVRGAATFGDLMFDTPGVGKLTFTVLGNVGEMLAVGSSVETGDVTVSATVVPASAMRFSSSSTSSFITPQGAKQQTVTTSNALAPGVVIEIIDSSGQLDTAFSSGQISVTTTSVGVKLSGDVATVSNGVSTFDKLMFLSCAVTSGELVSLTFTVSSTASPVPLVNGKSLVSPSFTVVGAPNTQLAFSLSSGLITSDGQSVQVTVGVTFSVSVEVRDSCGRLSSNGGSVTLDLQTSAGTSLTPTASPSVATSGGLGTFTSLAFSEVPSGGSSVSVSVSVRGSGSISPLKATIVVVAVPTVAPTTLPPATTTPPPSSTNPSQSTTSSPGATTTSSPGTTTTTSSPGSSTTTSSPGTTTTTSIPGATTTTSSPGTTTTTSSPGATTTTSSPGTTTTTSSPGATTTTSSPSSPTTHNPTSTSSSTTWSPSPPNSNTTSNATYIPTNNASTTVSPGNYNNSVNTSSPSSNNSSQPPDVSPTNTTNVTNTTPSAAPTPSQQPNVINNQTNATTSPPANPNPNPSTPKKIAKYTVVFTSYNESVANDFKAAVNRILNNVTLTKYSLTMASLNGVLEIELDANGFNEMSSKLVQGLLAADTKTSLKLSAVELIATPAPGTAPSSESSSPNMTVFIGIAVGLAVIVTLLGISYWVYQKRSSSSTSSSSAVTRRNHEAHYDTFAGKGTIDPPPPAANSMESHLVSASSSVELEPHIAIPVEEVSTPRSPTWVKELNNLSTTQSSRKHQGGNGNNNSTEKMNFANTLPALPPRNDRKLNAMPPKVVFPKKQDLVQLRPKVPARRNPSNAKKYNFDDI